MPKIKITHWGIDYAVLEINGMEFNVSLGEAEAITEEMKRFKKNQMQTFLVTYQYEDEEPETLTIKAANNKSVNAELTKKLLSIGKKNGFGAREAKEMIDKAIILEIEKA